MPDEAASEPKVIKRYTNRKLYDTVESRYVTLDEIAEMVKQGVEVKIVDNRTKEDLTSVTLAQIVFEEEKKTTRMPLSVLREIIRRPGEQLSEFIKSEVTPRVTTFREEAESRLDKLLRREDGTVADPDEARGVDVLDQVSSLIRVEHRRFPFLRRVARPAHGGRWIHVHHLTDHQMIEERPDRGEVLLDGRR